MLGGGTRRQLAPSDREQWLQGVHSQSGHTLSFATRVRDGTHDADARATAQTYQCKLFVCVTANSDDAPDSARGVGVDSVRVMLKVHGAKYPRSVTLRLSGRQWLCAHWANVTRPLPHAASVSLAHQKSHGVVEKGQYHALPRITRVNTHGHAVNDVRGHPTAHRAHEGAKLLLAKSKSSRKSKATHQAAATLSHSNRAVAKRRK